MPNWPWIGGWSPAWPGLVGDISMGLSGIQWTLLAAGVVALLSGLLKFRGRVRQREGTSPLALLEMGVGGLSLGAAGRVSPGVSLFLLACSVLVVILGTTHQFQLLRAARRRRELSESARLRSFLSVGKPGL